MRISLLIHLIYYQIHRGIQHIVVETTGRQFADDIFTFIFFNENCIILTRISIKFVDREHGSN